MAVYIIRAGSEGPVKIGKANNPVARITALQGAHYEELRVVRLLSGGRREEQRLHNMFAALHIRGEWFRFSPDMLGDIGVQDVTLAEAIATHARPEVPAGLDKSAYRSALRFWNSLASEDKEATTVMGIYARIMTPEVAGNA